MKAALLFIAAFHLSIFPLALAFLLAPSGKCAGLHSAGYSIGARHPTRDVDTRRTSRTMQARGPYNALRTCSMSIAGAGAADEDDWYDSDKWESFRKSGARQSGPPPAGEQAGASPQNKQNTNAGSGDVVEAAASERERERARSAPAVEWLRVAGCDVCLPRERKRLSDARPRFAGLVHFIGGAFVGALPRQAYSVLIEALVAQGRLVVVATPCSGLAGMDHYKAAYEAAFKFQTACRLLRTDLGPEVFNADELPTIGVAHSLGCKVQVLLSSMADTRAAVGRQRAANVHLAFNNYAASESVPVLKDLTKLQQDFGRSVAASAPVLEQISTFASELKGVSAFKDVLGTAGATQALSFLEDLGRISRSAAASAAEGVLEEFSPSPPDTMRLLTEEYSVSRNLVIKFLEDEIDQSIPLCEKLRDKFTGPNGSGGRLELKRLAGSHVTPNTPDLRDLSDGRVDLRDLEAVLGDASREQAKEKMAELDACAHAVLAFLQDEFARDWLRPQPPAGNARLESSSEAS